VEIDHISLIKCITIASFGPIVVTCISKYVIQYNFLLSIIITFRPLVLIEFYAY
jgi:hypothetical protein